ncbi:protein FAM65B [Platysternon megacephalum]|uniref:small monomeric GTPase n=1 Tax=Platysternon megacephalum TaxID=55544 RepID=A0A4D9DTP3_9SAUR|nr:protein FAM65B [Platysternon megacephalum]
MAGPGHRSAGKPLLVKIVMAGESCVGKTSIVRTYTEPSPAGPPRAASYLATVGIDFKVKTITFNDTTVKLQIWDTAGQEQFHTISTSYFRGARGFVLVYDITNSDSFQGITSWMKDIHQKADDEVDIVLLGNKCDKETERVIPKHRGEKNCKPQELFLCRIPQGGFMDPARFTCKLALPEGTSKFWTHYPMSEKASLHVQNVLECFKSS